jgi:hypothetical protein
VQTIHANQTKLAGLPVPADLSPEMKAAIRRWIDQAFIFGFQVVMLICAALAITSAAVTLLMIKNPASRS